MRASEPRWPRWAARLAAVLLVGLGAGLLAWQWPGGEEAAARDGSAGAAAAARRDSAALSLAGSALYSTTGSAARAQLLALWQQRFDRAEHVFSSYRDTTRYPPESGPIELHPDQARPFDPVTEDKRLRDAGGRQVAGVRLRTTQDRVFVSGGESVRFTIEAVDDAGRSLPLAVHHSLAQSVPDTTALIAIAQATVAFTDDGGGADETASDGRYSARLTPATQGFSGRAGTIRLLVQLSANGQPGVAHFDLVYVPTVPATWSGTREALEGGSLNFYLKAQVQEGGRYVVTGRVYDAAGAPFALLQFNEEVAAGAAEFKLRLFGALARDRNPAFPLRMVDVEGFLLRADTFPDRALMPRLPGTVHTSRRYAIDSFSPAEWTSEERERNLAEYGRDVQEAQQQIERLRTR